MFGVESTSDLHLATEAKGIDNGFEEQIKEFYEKYPDTKLIIIDVLQRVRELGGKDYSYASDYVDFYQFTSTRDLYIRLFGGMSTWETALLSPGLPQEEWALCLDRTCGGAGPALSQAGLGSRPHLPQPGSMTPGKLPISPGLSFLICEMEIIMLTG